MYFLVNLRNKNSHAKIFERARVADTTVFHPEIVHLKVLFPEPLGPEEV